jgi:hypothetical protein
MTTTALDQAYACDRFGSPESLTGAERPVIDRLRSVLPQNVRSLLSRCWESGEFSYQIMSKLIALGLMDHTELTIDGAVTQAARSGNAPTTDGRSAQ